MFQTIEEGIEIYRKEVTKYVEWYEKTTANFPNKKSETILGMLDKVEYAKLNEWNAKMQGMAEALGLTKEEVKKIDSECGVLVGA